LQPGVTLPRHDSANRQLRSHVRVGAPYGFQAERSLAQRVAGAVTDDPDTIELYFGYARASHSAQVHVPDEADARRAIRGLADHQVLHIRHYDHDRQQDLQIR
jgi:hypothetical protein